MRVILELTRRKILIYFCPWLLITTSSVLKMTDDSFKVFMIKSIFFPPLWKNLTLKSSLQVHTHTKIKKIFTTSFQFSLKKKKSLFNLAEIHYGVNYDIFLIFPSCSNIFFLKQYYFNFSWMIFKKDYRLFYFHIFSHIY